MTTNPPLLGVSMTTQLSPSQTASLLKHHQRVRAIEVRVRTGEGRRQRRTLVLQRVIKSSTPDQLWALGERWLRRANRLGGGAYDRSTWHAKAAAQAISAAFMNAWHARRGGASSSYARMVELNLKDLILLGQVDRCANFACHLHADGCDIDCTLSDSERIKALQRVASVLGEGPRLDLWMQDVKAQVAA